MTYPMSDVKRPILSWYGGKWAIAQWVIQYFPPHRIYVEAFGGAGSVLLRKAPSYSEVYNDLDDDVVNIFRILRDENEAAKLIDLLRLTPFSRAEFMESYDPIDDPIEQARRMIVRSYMGFGSHSCSRRHKTGFRSNANRSGTTPAHDWRNYPEALSTVVDRLRGVLIDNRRAIDVMLQHDGDHTLHYVDPPYLPETRSLKRLVYRHEMDMEEHAELLEFLLSLKGMVVLSGYASELYDDMLSDWGRVERGTYADGARPRTEVMWCNPQCVAQQKQLQLI